MSDSWNEFARIYGEILRPGAKQLMRWMLTSGIRSALASAGHHLAEPGGLCTHSVNVYKRLKWLCQAEKARDPRFRMPTEETMAILGLLHDLCKVQDGFPFGHGDKSVYLIQKHMQLTDEEAMAIRWHMASWNDGEKKQAGEAFEKHETALLLHMADELATFVDER